MSKDTIYREDAIKAINLRVRIPHDVASALYASMAINAICSVPSADRPQNVIAQIIFDEEKLREVVKEAVERFKEEYEITDRPQGEWIGDEEQGTSTCSNCGIVWQFTDGTNGSNFCPNCGAQMDGEREGE